VESVVTAGAQGLSDSAAAREEAREVPAREAPAREDPAREAPARAGSGG
jgi:hypothetical protein